MFKINNKKLNIVFSGLGILTILALGVIILPENVSADRAGYVTGYGTTRWPSMTNNDDYNFSTRPNIIDYRATPVVYSGNAPTPKTTTTIIKKTTPVESGVVLGATDKKEEKDLVASVVYGEDTFLPSGIVGWILFAIFVLIIIILTRKVFGGEKDYHETPLKHA